MASSKPPPSKPIPSKSHDATATTATPPPAPMIRGASLLIGLQLLSRLATFLANQIVLRFLTAPLLGVAAQLDVYYLSVLFFARESLRVAVQRQPAITTTSTATTNTSTKDSKKTKHTNSTDANESQAIINLGYIGILIGIPLALILARLYLSSTSPSTLHATPYLLPSLHLYALAAVIELLSEPCFVLMQTRLRFGTRAAAESAATVLRCGVVFASAAWASRRRGVMGAEGDLGVLPFALGQMAYGVALLLVYLVSGYRLASCSGFSLLPRAVSSGDKESNFVASYFYRPTVALAGSMMAQGVVKHLLTQGDTFLVSLLSTPDVQGVYALVANYGGLLARLLFQPVEESSRSYFSRLLPTSSSSTPNNSNTSNPPNTLSSSSLQEAKKSLSTLLRLYILLSALIIAIGPFAASPLLSIVAGKQWLAAGAGDTLAAYCFYIPFLALNGVTESFVASVASGPQVHRQSVWMGAFSVVFAASAFVFMRVLPLGATGLVVANSINMLCRVVWSLAFIRSYFTRQGSQFELTSLVPAGSLAVSVSTLAVLYKLDVVAGGRDEPFITLVKIAGSAIPMVLVIAFLERQFLLECLQSIRGRRSAK